MFIKFLKDNQGNITGFISHIRKNSRHFDKTCVEILDSDYQPLFYSLVGRKHVKLKQGPGSFKIGGVSLKDEGDLDKRHLKNQKDVFKKKRDHPLNK